MVKVYIWRSKPRFDRRSSSIISGSDWGVSFDWGHVALEIPDSDPSFTIPRHYMSYWPKCKKSDGYSYDYDDDKSYREEDADCTISLLNLCESTLAKVWDEEITKDFHNLNHNCCTVTAEMLRKGFLASFTSEDFLTNAGRIFTRGFKMVTSPFQTFLTGARVTRGDVLVWSPGLIEKFAKYIKKITD